MFSWSPSTIRTCRRTCPCLRVGVHMRRSNTSTGSTRPISVAVHHYAAACGTLHGAAWPFFKRELSTATMTVHDHTQSEIAGGPKAKASGRLMTEKP